MNNFTKYICAGLAIALLIIQAIMIWGLYGNFSGSLNELSDCTRKQLPQLIDLFTTMIVTNWVIIAALLFTLFRPNRNWFWQMIYSHSAPYRETRQANAHRYPNQCQAKNLLPIHANTLSQSKHKKDHRR